MMLYRDTLTAHEWSPPVAPELDYIKNERQWLLIDSSKERCAFLHIYIACQNHRNDSYLKWNEDLFHLITTEAIKLRKLGFMVLAMGDFNSRVGAIPGLEGNSPDTNINTPRFLNFITEVQLVIINTLPITKGLFSRFMQGKKSLLDYGLVDSDHTNTVTSFVIDEEARYICSQYIRTNPQNIFLDGDADLTMLSWSAYCSLVAGPRCAGTTRRPYTTTSRRVHMATTKPTWT